MAGRKRVQNWDDLRHFLTVARTGILSAAADILGTDHTTVARHIHRLEERLTTRVFYRSNLGYDLTASGEQLKPIAETMEASYILAASMESENPAVSGRSASARRMDWYKRPRPAYPQTGDPAPEAGNRASGDRPRVQPVQARGRYRDQSHLAPTCTRRVPPPDRLSAGIDGSRDYLATRPPISSISDLGKHDFVGYIEDMLFTPELNYLSTIGGGITGRIRSTNPIAQAYATVSGSGLCVLPFFIAGTFPELVPVLPATVSFKRSFFMHIHEDNRKSVHVRAAAAFISGEVSHSAGLFG